MNIHELRYGVIYKNEERKNSLFIRTFIYEGDRLLVWEPNGETFTEKLVEYSVREGYEQVIDAKGLCALLSSEDPQMYEMEKFLAEDKE